MYFFYMTIHDLRTAAEAVARCHSALLSMREVNELVSPSEWERLADFVEALWRDVESLHEEFGYGRHVEELGNGCERKEEARA